MKKNAFTLMEVLMAMAIIGIIAAAVTNSLKNISADKAKLTFQNGYNHLTQTVSSIVSDENIYPNVVDVTQVDNTTGRNIKKSMCELNVNFVSEFSNATKHPFKNDIAIDGGNAFETNSGIYWAIRKQRSTCQAINSANIKKSSDADYAILFDIDGPNEGTNCPFDITKPKDAPSNCTMPDTFMFGINRNNEIIPYNDTKVYNGYFLLDYMTRNNYLQTK